MTASENKTNQAVWTTDDFDALSWHDCPIHGIAFTSETELSLDIDYICEWISKPDKTFEFSLAPATLVFHEVYGFEANFDSKKIIPITPQIDSIKKPTETNSHWQILLHGGILKLEAEGFTQIFRSNPSLQDDQLIPLKTRGGISFNKTPYK